MNEVRLGIDLACRADHRASLADERGEFIWSSWKFRTTTADLERLWAKIPDGVSVTVILEPTRNAWVPLSAWLQARGATVILVPPEQSADLRDYYNKHTKTDRLDSRVLARLPLLHPEGLRGIDNLGPAGSLRRAVRHRSSSLILVYRRRIDRCQVAWMSSAPRKCPGSEGFVSPPAPPVSFVAALGMSVGSGW